MKKLYLSSLIAALLVVSWAAAPRCEDLKDPKLIIKKATDYALSIDSYSYKIKGDGYDLHPDEIAKRTSSTAADAGKSYKQAANVAADVKSSADKNGSAKPVYKRYECDYKFKRPYLLQMKIIMSDYVPKLIYGGTMTYRPDEDPKVFWFKLSKFVPSVSRDITGEAGDFLYAVMFINPAIMEAMSADTTPVLSGVKKIGDRDAYIVDFNFKDSSKLKPHTVNFKKYGIPKEAQKSFQDEVNNYQKDPISKMTFYIDKENFLVLQRETYGLDGKPLGRKKWLDIKVNNLTKDDF